ncbi:MAG: fumarate reductase/succinate dehydrogenase flavoprotein subunit [Algoriphagus sp.]|uniref:fumarate reductase/succinate dehydrogenase flavoprotein subunit n=1 Tax=Algoriphagus sp. TaxID=1872435 RepID=UPI00273069E2|nr:fumarate reductase/succinate dehydrogenase flavoprotein subunit [Algoriphagus sp.]MDP2042810.1 fumarate reductase/succinate dehydrogenase flavoprotein subunit [Algoriphagus sp.]MDP3473759.1 fumarate reductase/succinate dehydrogenase flavoprotein subunit [Algoriphagus sp.]
MLNARIPEGPLEDKWRNYKAKAQLINPANRRNYKIIVVGTGLAGASSAASLAELGFQVEVFTFHDSARRAHSVAAQGGVNAAKDYKNDGDSVWRMFYDTLKGGDFRAREANVYRLAECSMALIDQAVAQGVPFAREYSGYLSNRSFGGVQVSRTFYARGQTGQQLLLGAYQSLMRQNAGKNLILHTRHEMLDVITLQGEAKGVTIRNLDTGEITTHSCDALILATGGYGKIYYLSTLAMNCNATAIWRAHRKGAFMAAPSWTQFHPTSLPQLGDYQSKLTLMSESLRNDGRIWVPKSAEDTRPPGEIPEDERDYYLERRYPAFGNLAPRDISSRAAKERIDAGCGVGPMKNAVYLDFKDALEREGKNAIAQRYGNLFGMYHKITGIDAYQEPMMIAPAAHFSMGGLWVDYRLMSNLEGLFVLGEANFADHGANRLGANSLLQACVDGYFIAPSTVMDYLAETAAAKSKNKAEWAAAADLSKTEVNRRLDRLLNSKGNTTAEEFHKELGQILYKKCGLSRNRADMEAAKEGLLSLQKRFAEELLIPGKAAEINFELEKAIRVEDYLEMAVLIVEDALQREESCGAHFREEYQTEDGEALRNDGDFSFVSAWEYQGHNRYQLHKEQLSFEYVEMKERSYK